MSEMSGSKSVSNIGEAPASWNTRYSTPAGFVCQLTIRDESCNDLLEKANIAMDWLLKNGFQPGDSNGYHSHNHSGSTSEQSTNGNGNSPSWCPIHKREMRRWEKNGKEWFSHKVGEGWCTGK